MSMSNGDAIVLDCSLAFSDVALPAPPTPAHLVWVDDVVSLRALADTLEDQDSFAVDVEHHSERSYLGFTCLLQISAGHLLAQPPQASCHALVTEYIFVQAAG